MRKSLLLSAVFAMSAFAASAQTYNSATTDPSTFFPLTADCFNKGIWDPDGVATYDEATTTLKTAPYGFGGWQYFNDATQAPIDISSYKYLVVELQEASDCGANFRMFDEASYWAICTHTAMGNETKVKIDLTTVQKTNDDGSETADFDPSHVYIAGFWSYGNNPIKIKAVYVSNDGENPVTGINTIENNDASADDAYYTLDGIRVNKPIKGVYIHNGKKVVIK